MPKHPPISNQELYDKLKESEQLIKSPRTKCAILNDSEKRTMRIPMKEEYEAESHSITPEAYELLEPIYRQHVNETGVAASTKKLAENLHDSVLRKEKLKLLIEE